MVEIASALNRFASAQQADSVSPILEIPASDLQGLLNEMVLTHNELAELVKDAGLLRGRELARLTESHTQSLRAEKSPITKLLLLNAYVRQLLTKIREALKSRPTEGGKVIQVCSKIMARAIKIVDHIKAVARDDPNRKEVSLDSSHARTLFAGSDGERVSRKETIRAMRRAEVLWPALRCAHRANDGRRTMRLTGMVEELQDAPVMEYSDLWQRSGRRVTINL